MTEAIETTIDPARPEYLDGFTALLGNPTLAELHALGFPHSDRQAWTALIAAQHSSEMGLDHLELPPGHPEIIAAKTTITPDEIAILSRVLGADVTEEESTPLTGELQLAPKEKIKVRVSLKGGVLSIELETAKDPFRRSKNQLPAQHRFEVNIADGSMVSGSLETLYLLVDKDV